MAERERRSTDRRAVTNGIRAAVLWAFVIGVPLCAVLAFVWGPVMRDLGGRLPVPGWRDGALFAAGLGGLIGFFRMRATRRYVSGGPSGPVTYDGSRALAIARANAGSGGRRIGLAESAPVRRWDGGFLTRADRVPEPEGVTE